MSERVISLPNRTPEETYQIMKHLIVKAFKDEVFHFENIDGETRQFISGNYECMIELGSDAILHLITDDVGLEYLINSIK